MTEIKIEKRKPIWPWVLAGLVIVALVGYFMFTGDGNNRNDRQESAYGIESDNDNETRNQYGEDNDNRGMAIIDGNEDGADIDNRNNDGNVQNGQQNQAVASYIDFVNNRVENRDLDHQTVSQAFKHLTDATDAKASEVGYSTTRELQDAKQTIEQITTDPFETTHADKIRKTADILSNELMKIQEAKYPDLKNEASKVRDASNSIEPSELAFDQSDEIKDFLTESAELLEEMDVEEENR
jgi:hypothetical protein